MPQSREGSNVSCSCASALKQRFDLDVLALPVVHVQLAGDGHRFRAVIGLEAGAGRAWHRPAGRLRLDAVRAGSPRPAR